MAFIVGGRPCVNGFDWSYWQAPRDLRAARTEGHEFMVVKASEGDNYRDARYGEHVARAVDAGLTVGAYHFARPDWSDGSPNGDGRQEAHWFLSLVDPRIEFVVLDLEATAVNPQETTDYVLGFWDEVIDSGMYAQRQRRLTYVGKWFTYVHAASIRDRCCLWIPAYTAPGNHPDPDPRTIPLPAWSDDLWPEGWCIWQYTSQATVAGLHPSDANVATTDWFNAIGSDTLHTMEMLMSKPVGSDSTGGGLFRLVDDGSGVLRRQPIPSQEHLGLLVQVGLVDSNEPVWLTGDAAARFAAIPVSNDKTSDGGALVLAVNVLTRIQQLQETLNAEIAGIGHADIDETALAEKVKAFLLDDTLAPAIARELLDQAYARLQS